MFTCRYTYVDTYECTYALLYTRTHTENKFRREGECVASKRKKETLKRDERERGARESDRIRKKDQQRDRRQIDANR